MLLISGAALLITGCPTQPDADGVPSDAADDTVEAPDDDDDTIEVQYTCMTSSVLEYTALALIPAGVFPMGSDEPAAKLNGTGDPTPRHDVYLNTFCIDVFEVTLERYEACVDDGVCNPAGATSKNLEDVDTYVNHYPEECVEDPGLCPYHPVNCKNHEQAQTFCAWDGGRLCTEAEWERVANGPGPAQQTFPWGEAPVDYSLANIFPGPYDEQYLVQVDDYPDSVSAEGVFNLIGNVYEWVYDIYGEYETSPDGSPVDNPMGPVEGANQVIRGGCAFLDLGYGNSVRTRAFPDFDYG